MKIARPEYPRPQFVRSEWLNLNGEWQFEIDAGDSGLERGLLNRNLKDKIIVPFCPESSLSGIGNTDFMNCVWYRRTVRIPPKWKGKQVLLHFQASDYDTTVWVNGIELRRHRGGFTPFTCYVSDVAKAGDEITIVVRARDYTRLNQPKGKQCFLYENKWCFYTRTTGIWQTVWMEAVPEFALKRPRITPDVANSMFRIEQPLTKSKPGMKLRATLSYKGKEVSKSECAVGVDFSPMLNLTIPKKDVHLWNPGDGRLYDIHLELIDTDGKIVDEADSYAGLRSVTIDGMVVKINGRAVFQRLVLDQGYYQDGILTAPTDKALENDIKLSMEAGFNGARLHEKVFEERFLYHADRLGYMVWGEFADWGCFNFGPEHDHFRYMPTQITQWLETLHRDYSHPCIIGWCPLNETEQIITDKIIEHDDTHWGMFLAAKAIDATRPVLDTSGYGHRVQESDIYDSHDYEQDPVKLAKNHEGLAHGKPFVNAHMKSPISIPYRGQPYFVSEFGGIWWNPKRKEGEESWGYGDPPKTIEEFYSRFKAQCDVFLDDENMFGYCYTQLTDVFQEQNGIYYFDREPKFDTKRLRKIQMRKAAVEKKYNK